MKPDYILFTDASVRLDRTDHSNVSAYAAVVLNVKSKQYTVISGPLENRSISFCEAWAIYQGLRYLCKIHRENKLKHSKILVVTDSKLNVQILTDWIQNVWDTSDWYHWKKKSPGEIKNQDLYRKIVPLLNDGRFKVKIVHINSHSEKNKTKQAKIFAKLVDADVKLDKETMRLFVKFNALADETAHGLVNDQIKDTGFIQLKRKKDLLI